MEMLKITLGTLLSNNFVGHLGQFASRGLPPKISFHLGLCVAVINDALKVAQESIKALEKTHQKEELDQEGKPTGNLYYDKDSQKAIQEAIDEMQKETVALPINEKVKVSLKKLDDLKINPSALEMVAASHLVEFVD